MVHWTHNIVSLNGVKSAQSRWRMQVKAYERVLDEGERIVGDLGDELDPLRFRGVVDAALQDAAAVTVRRDLDAVGSDLVEDPLILLGR